jgi:hypothetical protein
VVAARHHLLLFGLAVELRMQIMAPFMGRFVFLNLNAVGVRPPILPDPGDLPTNPSARVASCDAERPRLDLAGYMQIRC